MKTENNSPPPTKLHQQLLRKKLRFSDGLQLGCILWAKHQFGLGWSGFNNSQPGSVHWKAHPDLHKKRNPFEHAKRQVDSCRVQLPEILNFLITSLSSLKQRLISMNGLEEFPLKQWIFKYKSESREVWWNIIQHHLGSYLQHSLYTSRNPINLTTTTTATTTII